MKNALNSYGPLVATYAVYNDFYTTTEAAFTKPLPVIQRLTHS